MLALMVRFVVAVPRKNQFYTPLSVSQQEQIHIILLNFIYGRKLLRVEDLAERGNLHSSVYLQAEIRLLQGSFRLAFPITTYTRTVNSCTA